MMMLKKSKNYFGILQEKFKTSWDPSRAVSATLLKKKTQHCCLFKAVCKEYVVVFLASGGVFDPGAVNTQMAVQGASLNMFGGVRF